MQSAKITRFISRFMQEVTGPSLPFYSKVERQVYLLLMEVVDVEQKKKPDDQPTTF